MQGGQRLTGVPSGFDDRCDDPPLQRVTDHGSHDHEPEPQPLCRGCSARRGEELCDAATKTHITDDSAQYYDYALSYVLLFQIHDHIAREILHEDPHDTSYFGRKEVGPFLKSIFEAGASVDWKALLVEKTDSPLGAKPMLRYFEPLMGWLKEQNKGCKYTLSDIGASSSPRSLHFDPQVDPRGGREPTCTRAVRRSGLRHLEKGAESVVPCNASAPWMEATTRSRAGPGVTSKALPALGPPNRSPGDGASLRPFAPSSFRSRRSPPRNGRLAGTDKKASFPCCRKPARPPPSFSL